jgi:hypothetical protein
MKIKDYFDRVYVINLPSRPERLEAITRELKRADLDFSSGKVELFRALRPDDAAGFPNIGFRGCFLSHLQIIKLARRDNLSNVLIVEDDSLFRRRLLGNQERVVNLLQKKDWDLVYFGHSVQLPKFQQIEFVEFPGDFLGGQFYGVRGRIFDKLIAFMDDYQQKIMKARPAVDHGYDGVMNLFRKETPNLVTLIAAENLVEQKDFSSDIEALPIGKGAVLRRLLKRLPGIKQVTDFFLTLK